ncbi:hypothetical protein PAXRUDRAFT_17878 [Paxillus rubicundulus Ve08.2h10]|uniref:Uncharacterized protein n=1 Tax=Paxillus rubicundulus Ve08.2h10 TaxID=930991 RepID=A0A0D0DG88_9AGAM|nr:hypothetical protein PAXRUDRAFT_17878 [Paxillus rubicundulus Ve08.2h10]
MATLRIWACYLFGLTQPNAAFSIMGALQAQTPSSQQYRPAHACTPSYAKCPLLHTPIAMNMPSTFSAPETPSLPTILPICAPKHGMATSTPSANASTKPYAPEKEAPTYIADGNGKQAAQTSMMNNTSAWAVELAHTGYLQATHPLAHSTPTGLLSLSPSNTYRPAVTISWTPPIFFLIT